MTCPYHTMPCHTIPCRVHAMPCPYHAASMPYRVQGIPCPYHTVSMPYRVRTIPCPYHTVSMPCHTLFIPCPCPATPCPCHTLPCLYHHTLAIPCPCTTTCLYHAIVQTALPSGHALTAAVMTGCGCACGGLWAVTRNVSSLLPIMNKIKLSATAVALTNHRGYACYGGNACTTLPYHTVYSRQGSLTVKTQGMCCWRR